MRSLTQLPVAVRVLLLDSKNLVSMPYDIVMARTAHYTDYIIYFSDAAKLSFLCSIKLETHYCRPYSDISILLS